MNKDEILKRLDKGNQWLDAAGARIEGENWEQEQHKRIKREWARICEFAITCLRHPIDSVQEPGYEEPVSQAYLFDKKIAVPEIDYE